MKVSFILNKVFTNLCFFFGSLTTLFWILFIIYRFDNIFWCEFIFALLFWYCLCCKLICYLVIKYDVKRDSN